MQRSVMRAQYLNLESYSLYDRLLLFLDRLAFLVTLVLLCFVIDFLLAGQKHSSG